MFRQYLLLVRAPNLFTVPSNILAGYFAIATVGVTDIGALLLLVVSSIFLYISGIILNDYFDIEVDRKERPNRPLASGRIEKRTALVIAVISIIIGNILALVVSLTTLAVSTLLTSVIIAYNYRLKRNAIGNPLTMGLARFLNVVLGGSTALGLVIITQQDYTLLVFIGYCLFLYTAAISILSRIEIVSTKICFTRSSWIPIFLSFSIVFFTIVLILTVGLLGYFQIWFIFNLIIFLCVMAVIFLRLIMKVRKLTTMSAELGYRKEIDIRLTEERAQNSFSKVTREIQLTIKTMILSIIVLDSVFLSGLVGIHVGMAILLLVIPPILLGRKLYVT